ncbi:LysE/ArgO family amino acid transporter [Microcella frigidaquae]|uniref:L-lysine exporter family protein LysE/ArgO n=1 Tax=Microcella frigidaquae TaxID=424758 RepID=A0A840XIM3_9MICO|nr:LysE/ArgO family amino acid transporter [Microcella frigidaquae]MBB5618332.1 L-lysine exporter family protein LysE/ArgO [Microcella frigidaquae]NHN44762.1 amino acid transporter [Microcella frigidaquae]
MTALLAGLGLGLSLIIAIGAQNVFVLRQGIRREHVLAVVIICAVSDAVLIAAGIAGLGAVLEVVPWLIDVVRWAGAAFLVGYGMLAARRAWRPPGALTIDSALPQSADSAAPAGPGDGRPATIVAAPARLRGVLLTALALTWLNPHVYLDTVFLLGSIASTWEDQRWLFGAGAMLGSVLWFTALGFGARYLGRWLSTPRAWRWLDAGIAVVMVAIAVSLVWPR